MKRGVLLALMLCVLSSGQAFALLQCGPGGEITGSSSGTSNRVVNFIINWFTSPATYSSATTTSTSGCDGFLTQLESEKKVFVVDRYHELKEDASKGMAGGHVAPLAALYGCEQAELFAQALKASYAELFVDPNLSQPNANQFLQKLDAMVNSDPQLKQTCGVHFS